ncbi:MAG TPA: hypothetical protein VNW95_12525 [Mucilaginibacter sp.]|jgi:hypothetical protein|nr:hypothetical protein [Mucilaginibacter sp.]
MKNTSLKTSALLLMVLVLSIVSCAKKNGVTPKKKLSYQFKVTGASAALVAGTQNSTLTTTATTGANITWQSGYANVASISFEGKNQDNKQSHEDFIESAVYKLDLFGTTQLIGKVDLAVGTYRNVDFKIELKQTASGAALFLKGVYASAKGNIPVELSLNEGNDNMEIKAIAKDLTVGAKDSYIAYINLHLDKLIVGVKSADLDAATLTGGTIVISSTSNVAIYTKIKATLGNCSDGDYNN